jgi:hypothetical protein
MPKWFSRRVALFALVVAACTVIGGTAVGLAVVRAHSSAPPPGVRVVSGASLAQAGRVTAASLSPARGPQLLFINAIPDKSFRQLAVAPLARPNVTRVLADLSCDRVYFASGNGLCLTATGVFASHYVAKIFDANFKVRYEFTIPGIPSRARISDDGRLGAVTTFVNGDSYSPGNFSTRTSIVAMKTGKILADIEKFAVTRDGKRFHKRNFNYWGVTFERDDDHFDATLGSGAQTYLVRGSIRARTMRVIFSHLECPSLSPDGTRIAFKHSVNSHGSWRLYVLDLRTMRAHPLAETQSVDDQVEWLDNARVLYHRGGDVWVAKADGRGVPRSLVSAAWSPVVVR